MSDTTIIAAEVLKEHRDSIDRLDAILVYTLAERFKHTQAVGRLKATHTLPPSDPAREAWQIERLERLSSEANLAPEFAKKFLNFIKSFLLKETKSPKVSTLEAFKQLNALTERSKSSSEVFSIFLSFPSITVMSSSRQNHCIWKRPRL